MVVLSMICTYTRLYKYRVLNPIADRHNRDRTSASKLDSFDITHVHDPIWENYTDLTATSVESWFMPSIQLVSYFYFQFQWQYGQQFVEVQQGWGWTDGLPILRSGYGLCGFFIAGNEHVLIGTKAGASVFGGDISREQFKVWKR